MLDETAPGEVICNDDGTYVVNCDRSQKSRDQLVSLAVQLISDEDAVRWKAAGKVVRLSAPDVVSLISVLESGDDEIADDVRDATWGAMARYESTEAVCAFIDALPTGIDNANDARWKAACTALTRLMPRLKAADTLRLDAHHRAVLNRTLRDMVHLITYWKGLNEADADLAVAIVKGLESVGDVSSLPVVRRLSKFKAPSSAHQRVKEASVECLPRLELIIEQRRESSTLLRYSGASAAATGTLLRPAKGASTAAADYPQLLRASESEAV